MTCRRWGWTVLCALLVSRCGAGSARALAAPLGPLRLRGGETSDADGFRMPTTAVARARRPKAPQDSDEEEGEPGDKRPDNEVTQKFKEMAMTRMKEFSSMMRDEQIRRFQKISAYLKSVQRKFKKLQDAEEKLVAQDTESKMVLEELKRASDGRKILKLIGPCLFPQAQAEAVETVETRLKHIHHSLKAVRDRMKSLEEAMGGEQKSEEQQRDGILLQNLLQAQQQQEQQQQQHPQQAQQG
eukprot:Tamp_28495.p1 GENE.Tamp_28495~~Tamp_28495.p1  ORF type:complete len:251 (+),score=52.14 Tamp_28495:28-753(+)